MAFIRRRDELTVLQLELIILHHGFFRHSEGVLRILSNSRVGLLGLSRQNGGLGSLFGHEGADLAGTAILIVFHFV